MDHLSDDDMRHLLTDMALEIAQVARSLGALRLSALLPAADDELILLTCEHDTVWLTARGFEACLLRLKPQADTEK